MEIEPIEDANETPRAKRKGFFNFDWNLSVGQISLVFSIFISAASLYGHITSYESKVDGLESQNLPQRVSTLEGQNQIFRDGFKNMNEILQGIRDDMRDKQDKSDSGHH